ncbi:MAG: beta-lactamase family protein [Acidobacteria bacterium]|nr:beta-lactamase family protein [Acidobacteriota bacterium]
MSNTRISRSAGVATLALALLCVAAPAQASLDPVLKPYLAKYEIPALAAAVVKDGRIVAAGAVGTRRWGENIPVTPSDRFHLGSDTKAMTATLAAILVDQGKLRWDSTVGDVFPDLGENADPVFTRLTLEQLLSHTSGLPSDNLSRDAVPYMALTEVSDDWPVGNLDEIRAWLVRRWAALPMPGKPGGTFEYSNLNYVIVGAMIERLEGKTWDELIFDRIFRPLNLRTAGLGTQSTPGRTDAPLPHAVVNGKIKPLLAGPLSDNPAVIGPAGIAHMSVLDFARWAGWNAGEGKRGPALVKPETLKRLHTAVVTIPPPADAPVGTPAGGKYALGWGERVRDFHPDPILCHSGSNGMNIAQVHLDPKADFAVVLLANIAGKKANEALDELVRELFEAWAAKPAPPAPRSAATEPPKEKPEGKKPADGK